MAAFKLPKSTETEKAGRAQAIEEAGKNATSVPLETAELSAEVAKIISSLRDISIPLAAPDLAVALDLAGTAKRGAIENVRANLPSIKDQDYLTQAEQKLRAIDNEAVSSGGQESEDKLMNSAGMSS